jgi:hypothetical protein
VGKKRRPQFLKGERGGGPFFLREKIPKKFPSLEKRGQGRFYNLKLPFAVAFLDSRFRGNDGGNRE